MPDFRSAEQIRSSAAAGGVHKMRRRAIRLGLNVPQLVERIIATMAELEPFDDEDSKSAKDSLQAMLEIAVELGHEC